MDKKTIVCFDLGGVLMQICHTWEDAAKAAGVSILESSPKRHLNSFEGLVSYQAGELEDAVYLARLAEWLNVSEADAALVHQGILRTDYPGGVPLVESIKAAGYWTCCFSNTNALHWSAMTNPALHPSIGALDARHASHEVAMAKPDVEAYKAIQALLPPADEIIFFDDSLENVYGAAAAGWQAFSVDPHGNPVAEVERILIGLGILSA